VLARSTRGSEGIYVRSYPKGSEFAHAIGYSYVTLRQSGLERYRDESGCTILLASHNMAEVERLCSHVLMLKQGRIVDQGSPQALLDRYRREDMEEVFLDIARDRRRAVAPA